MSSGTAAFLALALLGTLPRCCLGDPGLHPASLGPAGPTLSQLCRPPATLPLLPGVQWDGAPVSRPPLVGGGRGALQNPWGAALLILGERCSAQAKSSGLGWGGMGTVGRPARGGGGYGSAPVPQAISLRLPGLQVPGG